MHCVWEVHAEQLVGQTKQEPLDRNLPVAHVEQFEFVEDVQVKQFFDAWQHSLLDKRV